ncbi:MAG: hypothetical protein IGS03_17510 [Candidatus Sericytochromatia bacterium]|nr:hypothetical protein [Candidatus Sericytochromatia bacterium]
MFFKLLTFGLLIGAGVFYYDKSKAETELRDAVFSAIEAGEDRCKKMHESLCKYYMTVKLGEGRESKFYKFRVPPSYYHRKQEELKAQKFTLVWKKKELLPGRILGLEPEYQTEVDGLIESEN